MKENKRHKNCGSLLIIPIVLTLLPMGGCDEGKIYPDDETANQDGVTIRMHGKVTGAGSYGNGYSLALAIFTDGSDFAEVSKNVGDGESDIELTNVVAGDCHAELCIINSLRKKVLTLVESPEISSEADDIVVFNIGDIDASAFNVINEKIFATTCLQCHGGTGHSAAGLDLNREQAYSMLVNVPSTVELEMMRVAPGSPSGSTLWEAVATEISSTWKYNHSNLLEPDKSGFITNWIEKGAEK